MPFHPDDGNAFFQLACTVIQQAGFALEMDIEAPDRLLTHYARNIRRCARCYLKERILCIDVAVVDNGHETSLVLYKRKKSKMWVAMTILVFCQVIISMRAQALMKPLMPQDLHRQR